MVKKKKIREEFDIIFKSGDEKAIKKMLNTYPWLLNEMSSEMDEEMLEQHLIIAAIGVMEDELAGSVSIDNIIFCLNTDFNIRKTGESILQIIIKIENLGLVKKESNGWILSNEGGRICDAYLNKNLEDIEL